MKKTLHEKTIEQIYKELKAESQKLKEASEKLPANPNVNYLKLDFWKESINKPID